MLLLFAAIPTAAAGAFLINNIDPDEMAGLTIPLYVPIATFAAAVASLALMIAAGIWFPAVKAMKINPAEALKDQ